MHEHEPEWGDAPDSDLVVELLLERYPIPRDQRLSVHVDDDDRSIALTFEAGRHRYRIGVQYLRGARDRDPWLLMADALDNLYGSLLDSSHDHKSLPAGGDVEFAGAFFSVTVEHTMPEMERIADQILGVKEES